MGLADDKVQFPVSAHQRAAGEIFRGRDVCARAFGNRRDQLSACRIFGDLAAIKIEITILHQRLANAAKAWELFLERGKRQRQAAQPDLARRAMAQDVYR
ncbi:hypothetical protein [Acidovorax sp. CCYZU-2555]|uniref:hypothetical protein n=1 Tax=Acidovorax sp. CCYZU-2555 TaxID=2835042 RepID=UPI0020BF19C3|nr:hypothetical protein [Acidovorax sp. CCYZU-2555]